MEAGVFHILADTVPIRSATFFLDCGVFLSRAYVVWFAFYIPTAMLGINMWWTPWWVETVQRWMGV